MLLRTHDQENKFSSEDKSQIDSIIDSKRIFYFSHSVLMDVNEILPAVDILISDYSSLTVDFLLCNKPIIYIPYDLGKISQRYYFGFLSMDTWS